MSTTSERIDALLQSYYDRVTDRRRELLERVSAQRTRHFTLVL